MAWLPPWKVWHQIKIWLRQSMHICLKNNSAEFHPDPIWNGGSLGFLKEVDKLRQVMMYGSCASKADDFCLKLSVNKYNRLNWTWISDMMSLFQDGGHDIILRSKVLPPGKWIHSVCPLLTYTIIIYFSATAGLLVINAVLMFFQGDRVQRQRCSILSTTRWILTQENIQSSNLCLRPDAHYTPTADTPIFMNFDRFLV